MKLTLSMPQDADHDDSVAVNQLARELDELGNFAADVERKAVPPGSMDLGLSTGLTIVGIALDALGILVSAISNWAARHPYTVTLKRGQLEITLVNASPRHLAEVLKALNSQPEASTDLVIEVSRK